MLPEEEGYLVELTLTHQTRTHINVHCDGNFSHTFQLLPLQSYGTTILPGDPIMYGKKLYDALFAPGSLAQRAISTRTEQLLLVATADDIDALPWEYAYGADGFLVLQYPFVRTLPVDQRVPADIAADHLRIVAIPAHPLSHELDPLDTEEEWLRLQEVIAELPYAITLERSRPPTLERMRHLLAGQRAQVVHFMGHGGQEQQGAVLCFERDNGDLQKVTARELTLRIRDSVFLVVLNACVSAAPGPTAFSNLASALVQQKIPYALGMRLSITDEDARTFSRVFYSELARGIPVEEALLQTRLALADSHDPRVIGIPVLYTSLTMLAPGFPLREGRTEIKAYQPHTDLSALPRVVGLFQGRIDELKALGRMLAGNERARLITIHGPGGQGKSALAREAAERFAHAWPGGVWAANLENLPDHATFLTSLARFLEIKTQDTADLQVVERRIQASLAQRRTLLLIDNAEVLVEAVEKQNNNALQLAAWLRQLPGPTVSLLVTARVLLGWDNEQALELAGLSAKDGAALFSQCAPQRASSITHALAQQLSHKVEGHPLSLRLLGSVFNSRTLPLSQFIQQCEEHLLNAEDIYKHIEHRHRKLYSCIEISIKELDEDVRTLLGRLTVFHSAFLAETAATMLAPISAVIADETVLDEEAQQTFHARLQLLWQRGLLSRQHITTREETLEFYYLLPVLRLYAERYLENPLEHQALLKRFGTAYAHLSLSLSSKLESSPTSVVMAQQLYEDLERGLQHTTEQEHIDYLIAWGWVIQHMGATQHGLMLLEEALEIVQGQDQQRTLLVSQRIGLVYRQAGQPQEALILYQQALPQLQAMGDRAGEASTLTNIAGIYGEIGKPQAALTLYEQALAIVRTMDDHSAEVTIVNDMGVIYSYIGQPQEALKLYAQFLPALNQPGPHSLDDGKMLANIALAYSNLGRWQEALASHEQALAIMREFSDRATEGVILGQMALVCDKLGQREKAYALYEQALSIHRATKNRTSEAITLSGMALIYDKMGRSQEALDLYSQVLPLTRALGNSVGEAATLSNMALAYKRLGKFEPALTAYEQALPIRREVGDRSGEASTLAGIAGIYNEKKKQPEALTYYEQALAIRREIGDRAGEARMLNNMAIVYGELGQLQQEIALYEEALPIRREVGDRPGEAATLYNIASIYNQQEQSQKALSLYKEALSLMREVSDRKGEAGVLAGMVSAYSKSGQLLEALTLCEEALPILREVGDRAGEVAALTIIANVSRSIGDRPESTN